MSGFNYDEYKRFIVDEIEPAKNQHGKYYCPICGSGTGKHGTAAASLNDDYSLHCYACGFHGDIFDLYGKKYGIDKNAARDRVLERYGAPQGAGSAAGAGSDRRPPAGEKERRTERKEVQRDYTGYIDRCAAALEGSPAESYMMNRGFTAETLQAARIGYDQTAGAVVIPYPHENYYITRSIEGKAYRKPTGAAEPIYNAEALTADRVFITEGQLDALSIIQAGGSAVAIGGAGVNKLKGITIKGKAYFVADNDVAGERTAETAAKILRDNGARVRIIRPHESFKDVNELLQKYPDNLKKLVENPEKYELDKQSAANYANDLMHIDAIKTEATETGFLGLDAALGGGIYAGLYVIGAVSSLGKTTFALQIADQIAAGGRDVLFFSLEMERMEIIAKSVSRITLQIAGNSTSKAKTTRGITDPNRRGRYSYEEHELLANAIEKYSEAAAHLWIDEGLGTIGTEQIKQRIEDHITVTGNRPIVFIDYLQILQTPDIHLTDKQATDRNVFELKRISRQYKLPIVAISSLNRDNYTAAINMAAFKESGAIEYSSDVLIGLQPQGMEEGEKKETQKANAAKMNECKAAAQRELEAVILKNRHGAAGVRVNYAYLPAFNSFTERP